MNPATQLNRHRRIVLCACILLWIIAFAATHIPAEEMPRITVRDVTLHAVGYFCLGAVFWLTIFAYRGRASRRAITVIIILAAYGGFDELTQPIVNRCAAWGDWFADIAGTATAVALLEVIEHLSKRLHATKKPAAD